MHSQQKGSSVWSNPFCSGATAWGGWVTTGGSGCHLTHQQQSPCKGSVQSITSNIRLFSHPATETPPYTNPAK